MRSPAAVRAALERGLGFDQGLPRRLQVDIGAVEYALPLVDGGLSALPPRARRPCTGVEVFLGGGGSATFLTSFAPARGRRRKSRARPASPSGSSVVGARRRRGKDQ